MPLPKNLDRLLRAGINRYQVPGASLAVMRGGRIIAREAAGVVNLNTGVKTTPDSVFQIGSITKPLTATLIMQLVDEGLLSLDDPVINYLPDFRVERLDVSNAVTVRQLLSHTSGIDGDFFVQSTRGDDAIERFLDKITLLPSLFEPGQMMSYCNVGYAVLGRIIELLRRKSYDQALQDHLFKPLGMDHAVSRPEDMLAFSCAIGHLRGSSKKQPWHVAPDPFLVQGQKSAGATPAMTASDLLTFAAMHMAGGKSAGGARVLSSSSVKAMQKRQIKLIKHAPNAIHGWGLSWMLIDWDGHKLYGHDGATIGQFAFMRILPEKNLAVVLLTNGGDAKGLYETIFRDLFEPLAKIGEPGLPDALEAQPDLSPFTGIFENTWDRIELTERKGHLVASGFDKNSTEARISPKSSQLFPKNSQLVFVDKNTARFDTGDEIRDRTMLRFSFHDEAGTPQFVQLGVRQFRRVR